MTTETETLTPEQEQQAADDAFASAFNDVLGSPEPEPRVEPPKEESPVEAQPEPEAEKEEPAAEEPAAPDPVMTRLDAMMAKFAEMDKMRAAHDKLSGHVGNVLQQLQELKTAAAQPKPPESNLPPVDPKEFEESYPEFASYLRDRLAAMAPAQPAVPPDLVQRLAAAEERSAKLAQDLEERTITFQHPDWAEVVNSTGYSAWLAAQPETVQETARSTPYASELAKVIGAYKDSTKKAKSAAEKQQRLAAALPPSAVTQTPKLEPSEDEAFSAGWNAVRGRK